MVFIFLQYQNIQYPNVIKIISAVPLAEPRFFSASHGPLPVYDKMILLFFFLLKITIAVL
jgi:hypothetical protein